MVPVPTFEKVMVRVPVPVPTFEKLGGSGSSSISIPQKANFSLKICFLFT
jgi:hypothetical protein